MNDDELDRALASLTDASPSPALHANVMRRVADDPAFAKTLRPSSRQSRLQDAWSRLHDAWDPALAGFGWRLALAATAVIVIGAAVWLAVRPAPAPQTVAVEGVGSPRGGRESSGGSGVVTPPTDQPRAGLVEPRPEHNAVRRTGTTRSHRVTAASLTMWSASAQPASGLEEIGIPPLTPPDPLPPPDPAQVAPLTVDAITVEQLEIPPLQIDPVEGKPSKERGR